MLYIYGSRDRLIDPVALENLKQRLKLANLRPRNGYHCWGQPCLFKPVLPRQVISTTVAWIQPALHASTNLYRPTLPWAVLYDVSSLLEANADLPPLAPHSPAIQPRIIS